MPATTYRVGIIGVGFIGKVHAYAYQTLPFYYETLAARGRVTHVCTSHRETASRAKTLLGAEVATTRFEDITESPDVDIVHICTPNNLHQEALLSAIQHNKHIYCDKPLTATLEEALEVEAALPRYRGIAQMTFQCRFFPAIMRAKQLIDDGFLGEPLEFRVNYLHAGSANPDAPLKWKLSAASGGGVIADLASHALDLTHHLLGEFEEVLAVTRVVYPDRPSPLDPGKRVPVDAEDSVMMLTRMRSGAIGHVSATKIATGVEDELRVEIHGQAGALRFNSMSPHFLEAFDARAASEPIGGLQGWTHIATGQRYPEPASPFPGAKNALGWIRVHVACLAHFLEHVHAGTMPEPSLRQGIHVQKLMKAAHRSAHTRSWVPCPPRCDAPAPAQ